MISTAVGGTATTFAYRGDGLRACRTAGGVTTNFTWDVNAGSCRDVLPSDVDPAVSCTGAFVGGSGNQAYASECFIQFGGKVGDYAIYTGGDGLTECERDTSCSTYVGVGITIAAFLPGFRLGAVLSETRPGRLIAVTSKKGFRL
ncbi:MAG: hypothetical protein ACKVT1_05780 [Dehalococcoidia bacterium]